MKPINFAGGADSLCDVYFYHNELTGKMRWQHMAPDRMREIFTYMLTKCRNPDNVARIKRVLKEHFL